MRKIVLMIACMATTMCINAQALKVSSTGNVGIGTGTATPSQKLHVVGNSYFNGNVGIGTSPSSYKLLVNGTAGFNDNSQRIIIGTYKYSPGDQPSMYFPAIYSSASMFGLYIGTPVNRVDYVYASIVNYNFLTQNSDSRIKKNIQSCSSMLSRIKDIQTYTYNYTDNYLDKFTSVQKQKMQRTEYGFIAQELQEIFPEFVHEGVDSILSVSYISMIPVLTAAINELQQGIENRDSVIDALQQKVASLENIVVACCSSSKTQKNMQEFDLSNLEETNTEELKVYQNAPNPFNESTIISCYIPETIKKAELCIYDMSGSRLKCLTVSERGATTIQIQAGQLAAGVYTYLLIGDGKNSDAKQMILTK